MDEKTSTQMALVSPSQSHEDSKETSQASTDAQLTEATCLRNRLLEINAANRTRAAQNLRAIAHLLMSGALGFMLTFSTAIGCQPSSLSHEGKHEEIL